jgi:hypothetical protein
MTLITFIVAFIGLIVWHFARSRFLEAHQRFVNCVLKIVAFNAFWLLMVGAMFPVEVSYCVLMFSGYYIFASEDPKTMRSRVAKVFISLAVIGFVTGLGVYRFNAIQERLEEESRVEMFKALQEFQQANEKRTPINN